MTQDANSELTTTAHDDWIRATYKREPTDRDHRFFALRDSGYTGPIDQDGYAVTPLLKLF